MDHLNPFQKKPWFLRVCSIGLLKTYQVKGEIARIEHFFLFSQCFLPVPKTFDNFYEIGNCRLQSLSVWKSLKFVVWEWVNQFALLSQLILTMLSSDYIFLGDGLVGITLFIRSDKVL